MSLDAQTLRRALNNGLVTFNPKQFSVQSTPVGKNISLMSQSSSGGDPSGTIIFDYYVDATNYRETFSPVFPDVNTLAGGRAYTTFANAMTAMVAAQPGVDADALYQAQETLERSPWNGLRAATNFPAISFNALTAVNPLFRIVMGIGANRALGDSGTGTYFAYKTSTCYSTRNNAADTRCSYALAELGRSLRLKAFMRQSGSPLRYQVAYNLNEYAQATTYTPAGGISLTSRTLTLSTPLTMDIAFTTRLGHYAFTFPPLDITTYPWPTVPAIPASNGGNLRSVNYETMLTIDITSITALP